MTDSGALEAIVGWFDSSARTLPWRSDPDPWGVLVSEVMLQQTSVVRVLPVYAEWMQRWPTPADLAADSPGDAIRAWGRLGYPRRALRLHAAATRCRDSFGGFVPADVADLRSLPGVGDYTAAAVAAFAFGQRQAVLDTNVRRVHARWLDGTEFPSSSTATARERQRALDLLPIDPTQAANTSVAVMEMGALICTARTPTCDTCPVSAQCAWRVSGYPAWTGPPRRGQSYVGTDRQCRGRLLAALREADGPLPKTALDAVWTEPEQRERALDSLLADGLVVSANLARYRLPD
ncbi:MAG: A/G-specific adenine glycosylase [Actinomycetia bacterium]|nr:A/G-specific adenine glycosylase [Actinomycetes bacterium]